jgi:3-oxoacyl-[acyl-carrier-protein] synthase II
MGQQQMAIVGIGAVTGYGWGEDHLWMGLLSGKPAAKLVAGYGRSCEENVWLARVPDDGDCGDGRSRSARAMHAAAGEAIADARERGWRPGSRVGVLHALVLPEAQEWRDFYLNDSGQRRTRGYLTLMPSTPVSMLMQEYDFHGPAMNVSAMCASGNAALITAKMWLDADMVDDVMFVATDLSCSISLRSVSRWSMLSPSTRVDRFNRAVEDSESGRRRSRWCCPTGSRTLMRMS